MIYSYDLKQQPLQSLHKLKATVLKFLLTQCIHAEDAAEIGCLVFTRASIAECDEGKDHCSYGTQLQGGTARASFTTKCSDSNMSEWAETVNMCTESERTLLFHGASAHGFQSAAWQSSWP